MKTATTHISSKGAEKRFGDWCVGGRAAYQTINPPAEALV